MDNRLNLVPNFQTAQRENFRRHPLVANVPVLPAQSEGYKAILSSIQAEGIREPLKCVAAGNEFLVLDGIHRLAIAESLEVPELPYIEVSEEDAITVVCSALIRAEWSKSALAYRMWPMFAAYACQHGGNRKSKGNHFPLISASEIARKMGVSEKLVEQAKCVHAHFAKNPGLREEQECEILIGALPLHRSGPYSPKSQGATSSPPIRTIERSLANLPKSFGAWNEIGKQDRERAKNQLASTLHQLPRDVQETAFEALEVALGR